MESINAAPTSPKRGGKPRGQQTTHPSIAAGHGKPAIDWIECCPRGESLLSLLFFFFGGLRAAASRHCSAKKEDKQKDKLNTNSL